MIYIYMGYVENYSSKLIVVSYLQVFELSQVWKLMEPVECRAVIRFLYLKGRTLQETFDEMKETYGDDAPSYDLVKRWHCDFLRGW